MQRNKLGGSMPEEICANFKPNEDIILKALEVDCLDVFFEPEVFCDCCTKCIEPPQEWIGNCPDTKIEVNFVDTYGYYYLFNTYRDVKWSITQVSTNKIVLSGISSLEKGLNYSACVVSTDCYEFKLVLDNVDKAT